MNPNSGIISMTLNGEKVLSNHHNVVKNQEYSDRAMYLGSDLHCTIEDYLNSYVKED